MIINHEVEGPSPFLATFGYYHINIKATLWGCILDIINGIQKIYHSDHLNVIIKWV
jgi:hypothetical protein